MADISEIKSLLEADQKATQELADRVKLLEKSDDAVTKDEVEVLKKSLADMIAKTDEANAEYKSQVAAYEEKMANLEAAAAVGGAGVSSPDEQKHLEALNNYARSGDESALLEISQKSMSTNNQADGGYLVPPAMSGGILSRLRRTSPIRPLATIVSATTYEMLLDRGDFGYEWAGEKQSRSETTNTSIARITIPTHELSAMPKVTQRMIDDSNFDIAAFITDRVSDRFSRAENTAFVNGSGVDQPRGFMSYSWAATADESRADETFEYVATGVSGDWAATTPTDIFATVFYKLQPEYQDTSTWLMNNNTAAEVASLRDGDDALLMKSMLNENGTLLRTIHGRPVALANDMADTTANAYSIVVGDMAAAYTIVETGQVRVLRDPFSAKPFVLMYTTKRVGGGAIDFDAMKGIKFGTS